MIIVLQMSSGTGTPYFSSGYQSGYATAQTQEVPPKPESPKPPKKPLTPYMRFSTSVRLPNLHVLLHNECGEVSISALTVGNFIHFFTLLTVAVHILTLPLCQCIGLFHLFKPCLTCHLYIVSLWLPNFHGVCFGRFWDHGFEFGFGFLERSVDH